jgi:hypothetical protein
LPADSEADHSLADIESSGEYNRAGVSSSQIDEGVEKEEENRRLNGQPQPLSRCCDCRGCLLGLLGALGGWNDLIEVALALKFQQT